MLFLNTRTNDTLQRAMRAAISSHRPAALRSLLASQGDRAFADALCNLSGRVIADALSMLPSIDRADVLCRLPRAARSRLSESVSNGTRDSFSPRTSALASPSSSFGSAEAHGNAGGACVFAVSTRPSSRWF